MGIPFFQSDLASCLYIVNARSIDLDSTTFDNHDSGFARGYILSEQSSLEEYFPNEYFNSALAPMIRISYDENQQTV